MGVVLRYRELKNNKRSYYLDISYNGDRYREFLRVKIDKRLKKGKNDPKTMQRLAESIRNQRERELFTEGYEVEDISISNISFTEYFQTYANEYTKRDKRKILSSLKHFKSFFGNIRAKQLNYKGCKKFKEDLEGQFTKDTVRSYFGAFRKVVNQAVRDGIVTKNPCDGLSVKEASRKSLIKDVLTVEELNQLENASCQNSDIKNSFLLMCNTGLGLAECRKLKWEHIRNDKIYSFRRAKTDTALNIDLNVNAKYYLGPKGNKEDFVYKTLPSHAGYNKTLKAWVKRAGIEKHITSYCGRHTAACILLIYGANPKTVANILGHSSLRHTEKYLNHVDVLNKQALNSIPVIKPKNLNKVV